MKNIMRIRTTEEALKRNGCADAAIELQKAVVSGVEFSHKATLIAAQRGLLARWLDGDGRHAAAAELFEQAAKDQRGSNLTFDIKMMIKIALAAGNVAKAQSLLPRFDAALRNADMDRERRACEAFDVALDFAQHGSDRKAINDLIELAFYSPVEYGPFVLSRFDANKQVRQLADALQKLGYDDLVRQLFDKHIAFEEAPGAPSGMALAAQFNEFEFLADHGNAKAAIAIEREATSKVMAAGCSTSVMYKEFAMLKRLHQLKEFEAEKSSLLDLLSMEPPPREAHEVFVTLKRAFWKRRTTPQKLARRRNTPSCFCQAYQQSLNGYDK